MSYLYMAVTPDEYELPIAVEETIGQLARTLKVNRKHLDQLLYRQNRGKSMRNPQYHLYKIEVNWEDDDE